MGKQHVNVSHPPDIYEKRECLSHAWWVNNPPKNMEKEALRAFNGTELLQGHVDLHLQGYSFASKCGGDSQEVSHCSFSPR